MIVAVTGGGTGFIGHKVVQAHHARGDTVRILSRRDHGTSETPETVKWYRGDLSSPAKLQAFVDGADILYHCAGEIRDEQRMRKVHVEGTKLLIQAASGRIGRWVQLSSVGIYGIRREGVVTEQTGPRPVGMYEVTKAESDNLVGMAATGGAFEAAILRPSNVYGPEMRNQSLFGLISMIRRGWYFYIGPPGASANYIHVANVVDALIRCGCAPNVNGQIFNLSDYRPMEQFIATLAAALGRPAPAARLPELPVRLAAKLFGRIPGFPLTEARVDALTGRAIYSNAKIEQQLGYRHIVSMEEGLRELVGVWQQRGVR